MDLLIATLKQLSHLVMQVIIISCISLQYCILVIAIITAVQSAAVEKLSVPSRAGVTHQMNSPLMLIESFLQALTNADKDGRIFITRKGTNEYLRVTIICRYIFLRFWLKTHLRVLNFAICTQ